MTTGETAGPELVLGPMLRYVSETEATIWVETDRECLVEVLGRDAPTFEVAGHHYGLLVVDGLAPGSEHEYQVTLIVVAAAIILVGPGRYGFDAGRGWARRPFVGSFAALLLGVGVGIAVWVLLNGANPLA